MSSNTYHSCAVRECRNTSIKTPGKLWIRVPSVDTNMRKTWLKLAKRDPNSLSIKSPLYFCEDHFDLENYMENYMQYKIMGSVRTIRMKPSCVPSKFDCQDNPIPKSSKPRKAYVKRQKMSNIKKIDNQDLLTAVDVCNLVYKADKGVQVSPVQEDKAVQILLKELSDPGDANSDGAKKPGTSSKKRNHEPKQSSSGRNEIKVFCPKCKTEVSHTAEGIQEDQIKALIAKVFHYFEEELELLKKMTAKLKLSHLSKFRHRTAQATGVSEETVLEILQEETRRKAAKRYEQLRNDVIQKEVLQNAEVCQKTPQKRRKVSKNPIQTESSNEDTDDNVADVRQRSVHQEIKIEPENEELIVKGEPVEYYDVEPVISIEPGFNGAQGQIDPISTELKMEPLSNEMNEKRIEEESSTAEAPNNYRLSEKLNVSSLMEVSQVKVEKMEIEEEGFS